MREENMQELRTSNKIHDTIIKNKQTKVAEKITWSIKQ